MKIFSRAITYLLFCVLLLIITIYVINLPIFDESLNPEVEEILTKQSSPAASDNAFYALAGLYSSSDKNMLEVGHAVVKRYHANIESKGLFSTADFWSEKDDNEIIGDRTDDANWISNGLGHNLANECRYFTDTECLNQSVQLAKENPLDNERMQLLFRRYKKILQMKSYNNPVKRTLHSYSLSLGPSFSHYIIGDLFNEGQIDALINFLSEEMSFARMMLTQKISIIENGMVIHKLRYDLLIISNLIAKHHLTNLQQQNINALLTDLNSNEVSTLSMLDDEFRTSAYIIEQMANNKRYWDIGTLLNAYLNFYYEANIKPYKCISQLPVKTFASLYNNRKQIQESELCNIKETIREHQFTLLKPNSLYNIRGKLFQQFPAAYIEEYMARIYDINSIIRLVKMQLQLESIDKDSYEKHIINSDIRDPYNNEPIQYNIDDSTLKITCLYDKKVCVLKL